MSIAMIGGMVKRNCTDPNDNGEFCWPQSTQAYVLGSYFYGYTAQILSVLIAKHFVGSLSSLSTFYDSIISVL